MNARAAAIFLALFLPLAVAQAAPGERDGSFGQGNVYNVRCADSIHLDDGERIYVPFFDGADSLPDRGVWKIGPDGVVMREWGVDGRVGGLHPAYLMTDGGAASILMMHPSLTYRMAPDGSFTTLGPLPLPGKGLAVQADGEMVLTTRYGVGGGLVGPQDWIGFTRYRPDGTRHDAVAGGAREVAVSFPFPGEMLSWSIVDRRWIEILVASLEDDRPVLRLNRFDASRLMTIDGRPALFATLDPTFAANGRLVPQASAARWVAPGVKVLPDGKVLAGFSGRVARFGPDGRLDTGFGAGGSAALPRVPAEMSDGPVRKLHLQAGGYVVVEYEGYVRRNIELPDVFRRVVRLDAEGRVDPGFSAYETAGLAMSDSRGRLLACRSDGGLERRQSDRVRATARLTEFRNDLLSHYFVTADNFEADGIDRGAAGQGWVRTNTGLAAWSATSELSAARPVCRFYGDSVAGPNSHFYTADEAECEFLRAQGSAIAPGQRAWRYEGTAFRVAAPVNGACAANLTPVVRWYNGGAARGADPNHRYTTDPALDGAMLAQSWVREGVAMCAPPAEGI